MAILLSNDDGIEAPGMALLLEALSDEEELVVVAPLENRSGIGHAVTFDRPVRVKTFPDMPSGVKRVAVDGTPADAVKFALKHHMPEHPSLVISGVNHGLNVGVNVLYSGTLGAAFEALIHGVDALAVSVGYHAPADPLAVRDFTLESLACARELQARRARGDLPGRPFALNLNIPALPCSQIKGLRLTRQGRSGFDEYFHPDEHAPGHYHIHGEMRILDPDDTYDAAAVEAGYASLTPLHIDLTDETLLRAMRR